MDSAQNLIKRATDGLCAFRLCMNLQLSAGVKQSSLTSFPQVFGSELCEVGSLGVSRFTLKNSALAKEAERKLNDVVYFRRTSSIRHISRSIFQVCRTQLACNLFAHYPGICKESSPVPAERIFQEKEACFQHQL